MAPGKQNASAACPEDKLELNIFPTPALTWKYQSVEKPEFQKVTSSCFYSLSNVWTDQPLIPSSCCFWQELKVSATLKIAIFPYLRFQRFQIDMLESFLFKQKSEENIISVERYQG